MHPQTPLVPSKKHPSFSSHSPCSAALRVYAWWTGNNNNNNNVIIITPPSSSAPFCTTLATSVQHHQTQGKGKRKGRTHDPKQEDSNKALLSQTRRRIVDSFRTTQCMQTTKTKGKKEERREKKNNIAIPSSYVTNNRQPALSVNDVKQQEVTNRTAPAGGGNPN